MTDDVGALLVNAARDVLAAEGPDALTVRRVAAQAGVSTMNVYSRFGGKDGLVEPLFIDGFAMLATAMEAVADTDDPMLDLVRCGAAYREFALANPTYYAVMFERAVPDYEPSAVALERASATLQHLADRLARAMRLGVIRTDDPLRTAASVWATCHGVTSLEMKHLGPDTVEWDLVYRQATSALFDGLR